MQMLKLQTLSRLTRRIIGQADARRVAMKIDFPHPLIRKGRVARTGGEGASIQGFTPLELVLQTYS